MRTIDIEFERHRSISLGSSIGVGIVRRDQHFTHSHTYARAHTHTHTHTQSHSDTHNEANFKNLVSVRKSRNKTKNG